MAIQKHEIQPGTILRYYDTGWSFRLILSVEEEYVSCVILDTRARTRIKISNLMKKTNIHAINETELPSYLVQTWRDCLSEVEKDPAARGHMNINSNVDLPSFIRMGDLKMGEVGISVTDKKTYLVLAADLLLDMESLEVSTIAAHSESLVVKAAVSVLIKKV